MDILTLELFDVTVSQALLKVQSALDRHPELPLRILVDSDEMLRSNLERFLKRQGRIPVVTATGGHWQLDVGGGLGPQEPPAPAATTVSVSTPIPHVARPVLLLRSAFAPGDRALGRRLLLGVLETMADETPWVLLAHDALDLLEDPTALDCLKGLRERGIPVRLSEESLRYLGRSHPPFPSMEDAQWQSMLGKGELTVL